MRGSFEALHKGLNDFYTRVYMYLMIKIKFVNIIENSCRQTSSISCTLIENKTVDHADVVGASPVVVAPTTSSFSTYHWLQWIGQLQDETRNMNSEKFLVFHQDSEILQLAFLMIWDICDDQMRLLFTCLTSIY